MASRQNRDFSIVETSFLKLSRFFWSSRLALWQCWDRESQSRNDQDKSRPPSLNIYLLTNHSHPQWGLQLALHTLNRAASKIVCSWLNFKKEWLCFVYYNLNWNVMLTVLAIKISLNLFYLHQNYFEQRTA
jgi:hypothetical protein